MINEKFREILEIYDIVDGEKTFIRTRCIGEIIQMLLGIPTFEEFFGSHDIRFNDFIDSRESSEKVNEFISKSLNTQLLVGPFEFIDFLLTESTDNVLKNVVEERVHPPEGVTPLEFFKLCNNNIAKEFHGFDEIPFARNMTMAILNDSSYISIKGRENELKSLHKQLNTVMKPNVVLTGKGGVGKTALVEEYALRHKDMLTVYELNTTEIVKVGPDALKSVVSTLSTLSGNNVLFIDEFHLLCKPENYLAEHLKPLLARAGNFKIVVATTTAEFHKFIETDKALERRFFSLPINEIKGSVLREVLINWADRLSELRGITYDSAIIDFIVDKMRVERQKVSPDKEKDILDGAFAGAFIDELSHVGKAEVAEVMSSRLNIPKEQLLETMKETLLNLEKNLKSVIIGQDTPIEDMVRVIKANQIRRMDNKPLGKFLFVGPTSVGKTELAKQLAKYMFGSEDNVLEYNCNQMKEKYSVSSLLGSAPGYIGSENGGRLINDIRQKPFSVIIFDEFEKAHEDIHDVMLSLLDEGMITDQTGHVADATNCIIIFTTNIGAGDIDNSDSNGDAITCGFNTDFEDELDEKISTKENVKNRVASYLKEANNSLKPEFLSRIDEVIVFNKLTEQATTLITKKRIEDFMEFYKVKYNLTFDIEDSIVKFVKKKSRGNARRAVSVIKSEIDSLLGDLILEEKIVPNNVVIIWEENKVVKISSLSKDEYNTLKESNE